MSTGSGNYYSSFRFILKSNCKKTNRPEQGMACFQGIHNTCSPEQRELQPQSDIEERCFCLMQQSNYRKGRFNLFMNNEYAFYCGLYCAQEERPKMEFTHKDEMP